jgi:hypothetical protein
MARAVSMIWPTPFHQIVVEAYVAHLGTWILPARDVNVEALVHQKT